MSAVIEEATQKIESRMKELEPAVQEYQELKTFTEQWGLSTEMAVTVEGASRAHAQYARKGQTRDAVLKFIHENPNGVTVGDIAEALGRSKDRISYIYVSVQRLVENGALRREGRKIYPANTE